MQKTNQKEFRVEKVTKKKGDRRATVVLLTMIKKTYYEWTKDFFQEPKPSEERMKVELDLFSYATKADFNWKTTCTNQFKLFEK